jgi:integrase/recombinase XerD
MVRPNRAITTFTLLRHFIGIALGFIVKKYAQRANLDVCPHDLRHRFGYRMAQTTPLHRLAQIMGHDSLDTTLRYVQATRGDLQRDVEQIAWE